LAIIGLLYYAIHAIMEPNLKRMFAYSSGSHLSLIALGIIVTNIYGWGGSIYFIATHALASAGIFLMIGLMYKRTQSIRIENLVAYTEMVEDEYRKLKKNSTSRMLSRKEEEMSILTEISNAMVKGRPADELLLMVMEGIIRLEKANIIILFHINQGNSILKARLGLGEKTASFCSGFSIPMDNASSLLIKTVSELFDAAAFSTRMNVASETLNLHDVLDEALERSNSALTKADINVEKRLEHQTRRPAQRRTSLAGRFASDFSQAGRHRRRPRHAETFYPATG